MLDDFGDASRLTVRDVATAAPRPHEILVRVQATSINPIEWKMREGMGLPRAIWRRLLGRPMVLGLDFSGMVIAVGPSVRDYRVGDEVMGTTPLHGAYSKFLIVKPSGRRTAVAHKPSHIPHELAAVLPFAGLVAYAGIVTKGGLDAGGPGTAVLIVGGSGGVGHLAVQIAKHGLGAGLVVAVSSSRNSIFVRGCGADQVVEYDREPIEQVLDRHPEWRGRFDLIFDTIGIDRWWTGMAPQLLGPSGRFVTAALPPSRTGRAGEDVRGIEGIRLALRLAARRLGGRYRLITGLLGGLPTKSGLPVLVRWLAEGKLRPHIGQSFTLDQIAEAHRSSETGRTVGKISVLIP